MVDEVNYQLPATGFDSYLKGILPEDQAITAGALSISLQQIRNITKVNAPTFARVVYSMESIKDLPLVAGTEIPVDEKLATQAADRQALGNGPYGTYTMSNFYGAMSGLIYNWKNIYNGIRNLETKKLAEIYENLYLAVTWQQALAQYDGNNFTFITRGGGYGRKNEPVMAWIGGAPANVKVGTDPNDLVTFGRVISIDYKGPPGTVRISAPPGYGWPAMNVVVQSLIDEANAEIRAINNNAANVKNVNLLNAYWNITGIALKLEQRARFLAQQPVPIPHDERLADTPTTIVSFVDALPGWAGDTMPHMVVQTLEHICDTTTIGGQSVIALLRLSRNQDRLAEVGIILDDSIPADLPPETAKTAMVNGCVDNVPDESGIPSPCGLGTYSLPSSAETQPYNYYDNGLREITACVEGSIQPILDCDPNPITNPCSPAAPGPRPPGPINPFVIDPNVDTFPPPNINSDYTGSTVLSSIYDVNEAIAKVIECNCDCWVK